MPTAHSTGRRVAAGNHEVVAFAHGLPKLWQQLRRMLEVSVDDAQDVGFAMTPAMLNGTGQTALPATNQACYSPIFRGHMLHQRFGAVAAVVINYNQLVSDSQWIEAAPNSVEHIGDVVGFAEGGYDEGQLGRFQERAGTFN